MVHLPIYVVADVDLHFHIQIRIYIKQPPPPLSKVTFIYRPRASYRRKNVMICSKFIYYTAMKSYDVLSVFSMKIEFLY